MKTVHHRQQIAIGMLALALGPFIAVPSGQDLAQPPHTFKGAVDLVTIQASVRDARGRVVSGLTTNDFEVRDNGALRPILSLRSDRQSPLSVAILVDMSGSMRIAPKMAMARQAYDSVLSQLRQGHDEAAVFTFDASLHERRDFTGDLGSLKGALAEFDPFGSTSLYDATAATARRLAARSGSHKAIIVLTDGIDTSSEMTARDVSALASSIDVPLFVVATVPSLDHRIMLEGSERGTGANSADLRDLAEWTGGQLVFASTFAEAIATAATLIDELRQQYVIAIEAAEAHEWRRLEIRVKRPSAVVKARSGYFAG
jgi:VWFA-related protein